MNRSSKKYKEIRQQVLERDDEKCVFCASQNNIVVHHIIPRKKGGANSKQNMITLCQSCHMVVERNMVDSIKQKLNTLKDGDSDESKTEINIDNIEVTVNVS